MARHFPHGAGVSGGPDVGGIGWLIANLGNTGAAGATKTANTTWLPPASWTTTINGRQVVPRSDINDVAKSPEERQMPLAAENAPIRVTYGRDRIGAQIANVLLHGAYWVIQAVWGEGEIDGIESVTIDDQPSTALVTHYLGTAAQGVDPWLVDAFAAKGEVYSDALPGIAYSVFRVSSGVEQFPQIAAVIRGRKVFDPRTGLTAYSTNPALALADFLSSPVYGAARTVDWASVEAAADACDDLVSGEPRRKIGVTLSDVRDVYQHADVLRTYAGCWIVPGGDGLQLIPDRPASVVRTFDHAAGDILALGALRKRPITDAPTVMMVRYTDTTVTPWKDGYVTAYAPGVLAGTTPRRESEVTLPGIHSASQAMREAVERLNKLTLSDLSFDLDTFDEALEVEVGDVVAVTHPIGLTAKQMRVVGVTGESGRYRLSLTEYDPAAYSDAVTGEPSSPDTSLPDPGAPTPVTGLALAEEVYQLQDGTYSSRIRATWAAPAFPWIDHYRINVIQGGAVVQTGTAPGTALTWASGAVQEAQGYQVDIITVSRTGASSSVAVKTITAQGKQLAPGDVPSLTGFEVGGEVRLSWAPAVDIDIWRYEVRYGLTTDTWADATLIDRTDALRLMTKDIPAGTWAFMVKAVDSVGNYSPTEARRTITVTLDSNAFLVDTYQFDAPTVSGLAEYALGRLDTKRRWVTEDGGTVGSKFTAALSSYSLPMAAYNTAASAWNSETEDFGLSLSGNWQAEVVASSIVGAHDEYLDIGPDGTSWTTYPMVAKTTGRFAKVRIEAASGEVVYVETPGAEVRIDAVPRQEDGESTSLSSGGKTIMLANDYAAVKSITITPLGTASRTATVDAITTGAPSSFAVYLFNPATGAQVAGGFRWTFEGV